MGRRPYEGSGKDWSEATTSQRMRRIADNHQKQKEARKAFSLQASEGARSCCQYLDLGLSASRAVREYISFILSHRICGNFYGSPNKPVYQGS